MGIKRRTKTGDAALAHSAPEQMTSAGDVQQGEHPAKKRIRMAAELAEAMRQTGGKHRADADAMPGLGPDWKVEIAIVRKDGGAIAGS